MHRQLLALERTPIARVKAGIGLTLEAVSPTRCGWSALVWLLALTCARTLPHEPPRSPDSRRILEWQIEEELHERGTGWRMERIEIYEDPRSAQIEIEDLGTNWSNGPGRASRRFASRRSHHPLGMRSPSPSLVFGSQMSPRSRPGEVRGSGRYVYWTTASGCAGSSPNQIGVRSEAPARC